AGRVDAVIMAQTNGAGGPTGSLPFTPVAAEGLVFLTHASNPVTSLTLDEIRAIYAGTITNWKQVGGPDQRIIVLQRWENATQAAFGAVIAPGSSSRGTHMVSTDSLVRAVAGQTGDGTGDIGFELSHALVQAGIDPATAGIKQISIGGVAPTPQSFASGRYPATFTYSIATGAATARAGALFVQAATSATGRQAISGAGYVLPSASATTPPTTPPPTTQSPSVKPTSPTQSTQATHPTQSTSSAPPTQPSTTAPATTTTPPPYATNPVSFTTRTQYVVGAQGCTAITRVTVAGLADKAVQDSINASFRARQDALAGVAAGAPACQASGVKAKVTGTVQGNVGNALSLSARLSTNGAFDALNVRLDTGAVLRVADLFTPGANVAAMIQASAAGPGCDAACAAGKAQDYRAHPNQPFTFTPTGVTIGGVTIPFSAYWPQVALFTAFATKASLYAPIPPGGCPAGRVCPVADPVDSQTTSPTTPVEEVSPVTDAVPDEETPAVDAGVVTDTESVAVGVRRSGDHFTFTGTGFGAGEAVSASIHSEPVDLGSVAADAAGVSVFGWNVPADFATGSHQVVLSGASGVAISTFVVPADGAMSVVPPLPPVITGGNASIIAGTAAAGATVDVTYPKAGGATGRTRATVDSTGAWTVATPSDAVDGPLSAIATTLDGSASGLATGTLDVTVPAAPIISSTGTRVSGTAEAGSWVVVTDATGAMVGDVTTSPAGTWALDAANGMNGDITVVAIDAAGNRSPAATATMGEPAVVSAPATPVDAATTPAVTATRSGATYRFVGTGFAVGESVQAGIDSPAIALPAKTADSTGMVTFTWTAPSGFASGDHTVTLMGAASGGAVTTFTVPAPAATPPPPPGTSPSTGPGGLAAATGGGGGGTSPVGLAAFLLAAGAAGLMLWRRRMGQSPS
ncbi:MAG: Ig-like domain-containing protein, partial [Actinomycetia bacterium]|nr:Ig-like domain-containing protein [Actinomycetes bacterium]